MYNKTGRASFIFKMNKHNSLWLRAAVLGSLWASSEIIIGSFLHNLRLPFRGYLLTIMGIIILTAGYRRWPVRGLFLRAGIICALMKTISPSAVIMGPMIAIFMEAVCLETGIFLLGSGWAGCLLGGGLVMSWILIQQIANALIFYGPAIAELCFGVISYFQIRLGVHAGGGLAIAVLLAVHFILGALASAAGIYLAGRADSGVPQKNLSNQNNSSTSFSSPPAGEGGAGGNYKIQANSGYSLKVLFFAQLSLCFLFQLLQKMAA